MRSRRHRIPARQPIGWHHICFFVAIGLVFVTLALRLSPLELEWPAWILIPLGVLCAFVGLIRGIAVVNQEHDRSQRR